MSKSVGTERPRFTILDMGGNTMKEWEKVELVQRMQEYIRENASCNGFSLNQLYREIGYSARHANRIFKELLCKTPAEYIRAIRLTQSAERLVSNNGNILDVALETEYETPEGYSRAFSRQFGTTPAKYREGKTPIPLFLQYGVMPYYNYRMGKKSGNMEKNVITCTVIPVERPRRKALLLYSEQAVNYWTFCEDKGCEWEGLLNSIPAKLDTAAIMELPTFLQKAGYTAIAAGIELPLEWDGVVPDGYTLVELPPCTMLYFQTEPYQGEENFSSAIDAAFQALHRYEPQRYGYRFADELAPKMNFGGSPTLGARLAVPVEKSA